MPPADVESDQESEEEVEEIISKNQPLTISDDQIISDLWEVFNSIDKNQDGVITFMELKIMLKRLNQFNSDAEVQSMIKNVAENSDLVDFQSFVRVFMDSYRDSVLNGSDEEMDRKVFEIFDVNKDGMIEEIKEIIHEYCMGDLAEDFTEDRIVDMLHLLDTNFDGVIDFKKSLFSKIMLHKRVKDIRSEVGDTCLLPSLVSTPPENNPSYLKSSTSSTSYHSSAMKYQSYEMMKNIFSVFDRDNDGVIRHGELRLLLNDLGYQVTLFDVDQIIQNTGSNGCITFDEFIELIMVEENDDDEEHQYYFPASNNPFEDPFLSDNSPISPNNSRSSPTKATSPTLATLFPRTQPRNIPNTTPTSPSSRYSPSNFNSNTLSPPNSFSPPSRHVVTPSSPSHLSPISAPTTRSRASSLSPTYGATPKATFTKRVLSKNNVNNTKNSFNLFDALRKRIPLFKPFKVNNEPPSSNLETGATYKKPVENLKLPSLDTRSRRNSSPAVPASLQNQPSSGGFVGVPTTSPTSSSTKVRKVSSYNAVQDGIQMSTSLSSGLDYFSENSRLASTDYGTAHTREELRDAFALFDTNYDGKVSKVEMRNVMKKMGLSMIMSDGELDQLFSMVDTDGDGNINFDQFVELFLM